jgi:hypothetical protein
MKKAISRYRRLWGCGGKHVPYQHDDGHVIRIFLRHWFVNGQTWLTHKALSIILVKKKTKRALSIINHGSSRQPTTKLGRTEAARRPKQVYIHVNINSSRKLARSNWKITLPPLGKRKNWWIYILKISQIQMRVFVWLVLETRGKYVCSHCKTYSTSRWNTCNIYVKIYATSGWNNSKISVKHMQYPHKTRATSAWNNGDIWNRGLQHTCIVIATHIIVRSTFATSM